jgi:hypothetical protein
MNPKCDIDKSNFNKFFFSNGAITNPTNLRHDYDNNTPANASLRTMAVIDSYHDFFNGKGRAEQFSETICRQNLLRITRARKVLAAQNGMNDGYVKNLIDNAGWGRVFEYDEGSACFHQAGNCVDANKNEHIVLKHLDSTSGQNINDVYNQIQNSMMQSFGIFDIGLRITNWWAQQKIPAAEATMRKASNNLDYDVRNPNVPVYPTTFIEDTNSTQDDKGLGPNGYSYHLYNKDKNIIDAASTTKLWNTLIQDAHKPFKLHTGELLTFTIPDGYGYKIFNQTFQKKGNFLVAQDLTSGLTLQVNDAASVKDYINWILAQPEDTLLDTKILLALGCKRAGDWLQGWIAKDWYFGLQTIDGLCAMHAQMIGAPVVYDGILYNGTPSEQNNPMFYKNNLQYFERMASKGPPAPLQGYEQMELVPGKGPVVQISRLYFNKYKKYKQKYIELKNKLKK